MQTPDARQMRKLAFQELENHEGWQRAALYSGQADPFCCLPAWQLSFHEVFAPERQLMVWHEPGRVVDSVLVLAEQVFSAESVLLTPIDTLWFFSSPLLGPHAVDMLARAMSDLAAMYHPYFPRIVISGLQPGGATPRRLLQTFGRSFDFFMHSETVQCAASLDGGLDGFLSRRSANHRAKLAKGSRRAGERGIVCERHVPASADEARTVLARMLAVEEESWKGQGQCGMTEEPARSFYAAMLRRLAPARAARVMFARHEGRDVGFIFGGMAGGIYRGQQFSYDRNWKDAGIGNLLQLEQVAWLCEEHASRYDMGPVTGPRMGYKAHWTEKRLPIQTWLMVKKQSGFPQ
ncbi:GNAT family N-acetyltransferase [Desulfovibrio sp.]|uniref:GNAT family N-acetyltransferase n=1 Tax=Desulfovibrio sp. TaxID=885 RepID=UPI0025C2F796|nr:GNAT family N-acetyltransferase [Desulfovibrio sp.]